MITIGEEVLLLLLDPESGRIHPDIPAESLSPALSGAVLMDLAINNRIDTDLEGLFVVDDVPLDEPLLDLALEQIVADPKRRAIAYWVRVFSAGKEGIVSRFSDRLVERGILLRSRSRLFRLVSDYLPTSKTFEAGDDVVWRIAKDLYGDDIPDTRDIMIISLVHACGLWKRLVEPGTFEDIEQKIDEYSGVELISQAVMREISLAIHS